MINITSAQLDYWLALFAFPLSRILGMVATTPVFSNAAIPAQSRILIGLAITFGLAPALPAMPAVAVGSWAGLAIIAQQTLIGVVMGFTISIVFAAQVVLGFLGSQVELFVVAGTGYVALLDIVLPAIGLALLLLWNSRRIGRANAGGAV